MPRASREQARMNRLAIEEASSRLFREKGIQAVSVADLMGAVGLTAGGFYGHFASKDDLAAIACNVAFDEAARRWRKRMQGKKDRKEAFSAIVDGYLTRQNRDDPGEACPSVTLASDVAREPSDQPVRGAYLNGIKGQLTTLASLRGTEKSDAAQREAMVQLAMLVGTMALARASRGDQISDEFLSAGKEFLKEFAALPPRSRKNPP
jgi:TetR/AcrR family transcriptional repressor of nem operon